MHQVKWDITSPVNECPQNSQTLTFYSLCPRLRATSAAEDMFKRMTSLINASSDRLQHPLIRGVRASYSSTIVVKKPLLQKKNMQKRRACAKKHNEWTLGQWKIVIWSDESKCEIVCSTHVSLLDVKVNGLWRRCDGFFAVDSVDDFDIWNLRAHLTSMDITAFCHHPIWFALGVSVTCYPTGQWSLTHLSIM